MRDGLTFESPIVSDSAALHGLVAAMLATGAGVHVLRDPTRGGVAAALNEVARASRVSIELDEDAVRVGDVVAGPAGRVVVRTTFGARRVVPLPVGEQLPRIC